MNAWLYNVIFMHDLITCPPILVSWITNMKLRVFRWNAKVQKNKLIFGTNDSLNLIFLTGFVGEFHITNQVWDYFKIFSWEYRNVSGSVVNRKLNFNYNSLFRWNKKQPYKLLPWYSFVWWRFIFQKRTYVDAYFYGDRAEGA